MGNSTLYTISGAVDDETRIAVNAVPSIPVKQVNITHMHTMFSLVLMLSKETECFVVQHSSVVGIILWV